jgi:hypothetical protein
VGVVPLVVVSVWFAFAVAVHTTVPDVSNGTQIYGSSLWIEYMPPSAFCLFDLKKPVGVAVTPGMKSEESYASNPPPTATAAIDKTLKTVKIQSFNDARFVLPNAR